MKHLSLCSVLLIATATASAQQLQDPTRPQGSLMPVKAEQSSDKKGLALESVVKKNGQYKAIISGDLYSVGDEIGRYLVQEIKPQYVMLSQGAQQLKLELYSDEIK